MNSIIVILFLVYSLLVVFINNIYILVGLLTIQLLFIIFRRINFGIKNLFIFLTFIFLINFILSDIFNSLIITLRLCSLNFALLIVINLVGIHNIAKVFRDLFFSQELYLIISLSLTFIPIMKDEIIILKNTLLVKNYSLNIVNILKNPKVFIVSFINALFLKVDDLEKVMITMGFED